MKNRIVIIFGVSMKKLACFMMAATVLMAISSSNIYSMPTNLAEQYGVATASNSWISTTYGTHTPEFAIDGDSGTYWNAGRHGIASSPEWLLVDLQNQYSINSITLQSPNNDDRFLGYSNEYELHVSVNAVDWTHIASGILYDSDVVDEYADSILVSGPESLLQYIRYDVVGGTHWAHLFEMEVYGEDGSAPVPEPSTFLMLGGGLVGLAVMRRKMKR